jgi:hypothetical protein
MSNRFRREAVDVDAMIASIYPVSGGSLSTSELERAQQEIAAAIVSTPQRPAPRRRWRWLRAPRHVLLVGTIVAGLGGSIAAAASFLSAHTGYYPTEHGIPVTMSGPGEDLNSAAPDFCRVALQVSSDIPFPARYASWRDYVLRLDFGIKHPTPSIPCSAHWPLSGHVTTGWLGQWFAATAFCGWAQAWAQDTGSGDRAASALDAQTILHALDWRAVKWVDPHPDSSPAGDAPGGTRTKTTFGWVLFYQQAVRAGNRARVESLLAGNERRNGSPGFDECMSGADPDIVNFLMQHPTVQSQSAIQRLLLQHLRSEGI